MTPQEIDMTHAHTPGPWVSGHFDDIDDEIIIQTSEGEYVASIDCDGAYEGKIAKCIDANARLIAAAPDLLEALKMVGGIIHNGDDPDGSGFFDITAKEIEQVFAAIAKAKGGAS